jgi:hypothetical protein
MSSPAPPTRSGLLFETTLLSLVRAAFFLLCQRYVTLFLFADLRAVSEDALTDVLESPTRATIALDDADNGYLPSGSKAREEGGSLGLGIASSRKGAGARKDSSGPSSPLSPGGSKGLQLGQSSFYTKLSTVLFCLSFSESCMLFTLLLFGEAVGDR